MSCREYKLEDICKITIGKTPSRKNPKYWDKEKRGDNVWVSISDLSKITNKLIGESKEYISDEGAQLFKPVKKGTLLMSFKLSIGKLAFAEKDIYTNEAIAAFNIFDDSILSSEFLFYYFTFYDWDLETKNDQKLLGKTLNKKKLSQITISIPPLSVQKQIVEKLDAAFAEIDKAISATEKNIENTEALFGTILDQEILSLTNASEMKPIGDIGKAMGGKRLPKGAEFSQTTTSHPYLRITDFSDTGEIDTSCLKYIDESIYSQIERYTITDKDLYIAIVGATIGKTGIIQSNLNGANLTENAAKVVLTEKCTNQYLYYCSLSNFFKSQVLEKTKTAAQPKLALERLEQITIPVPSKQQQSRLVDKFRSAFKLVLNLRQNYEEKILKLNQLKSSILNQAFSGELAKEAA